LTRAATLLGHEAVTLDFRGLGAAVAAHWDTLADFDGVLVRTMPAGSLEQVVFRMDILHRHVAAGLAVLNPPPALETCIDKYLASARLEAAGLPVVPTIVTQGAEAALDAFRRLGGDVVVKPLFGSEGRGMIRVSDPDIAWRTFHALEQMNAILYLQQFIAHAGWDVRALVVGERVVAAMRRHSHDGWRTNVAQGGRAEPMEVSPATNDLALRAARAVGAPVAGVDLLPGGNGNWYVLEVNAVPGWRALGSVSGVDVAVEVMKFLASQCAGPGALVE
jgi:ribosomal protein S6--L-glutamate ligase